MSSETNSDRATTVTRSWEDKSEWYSDFFKNMNDTTSDAATVLTTPTTATTITTTTLRSNNKKRTKKTKTNVVGANSNAPTEVLPYRLPVYAEHKNLQFALCKPKLLPLKSHTLIKLERQERKVAAEVAAKSAAENRKKEILIHYVREDGDNSNFMAEAVETNWYEGTSAEAVEKIVNAYSNKNVTGNQFDLQMPFESEEGDIDDDDDDSQEHEMIVVSNVNELETLAVPRNYTHSELSSISDVSSSSEEL